LRILVQKFGGTSVATPEVREQVASQILKARDSGYKVVVVVSAMGRTGDPYATDTLIGLLRSTGGEVAARELDLVMSCGELISASVLAQTLNVNGQRATAFTGAQAGIITDGNFGSARILKVEPKKVLEALRKDHIVVVAGFQGRTEEDEITTLGRGGSDTTATALAAAIGAELVEIYTDVDGIMTADPRLVPDAQSLRVVTYQEVCEMAHLGAKVIHPRAVEIAMAERIPVKIKSTFLDGPGTLISDECGQKELEVVGGRPVTGIAYVSGVAQIKIRSGQDFNEGMGLEVFRTMANNHISVDLINVSPEQISFIIEESLAEKAGTALKKLDLDVEVNPGFAKVSAVGAGMRGVPGVMAKVVEALTGAGVHIAQTTDSHTNISCLVLQEDLARATQALHSKFGLGNK
jgi:aspartate kinase